jgi:predicted transcriptional regulator
MKINKSQLQEIINAGPASAKELAQQFQCSVSAVYYNMKVLRNGGRKPTIKSRHYPSTRLVKVIADVIKNIETKDVAQIARDNNCTREYVSQIAGQLRTEGVIK